MLLAAFSLLPLRVQAQIVAILRVELRAHGIPAARCSQQECQALVASLNPVLTVSKADGNLVLPRAEWERLLQCAQPQTVASEEAPAR